AFGKKIGFYMGVLRYFSASVAWGVMAVGVIKSTISIFGGNPNKAINVTIGFLILMAIITVINLFGQKVVKYVMNLATIGKDRKSTRLNSSHVSISYAVFCLKKKIQ